MEKRIEKLENEVNELSNILEEKNKQILEIESYSKVFNMIVTEAIKNETGKESKVGIQFDDKLAMARYFKIFNDVIMRYVNYTISGEYN